MHYDLFALAGSQVLAEADLVAASISYLGATEPRSKRGHPETRRLSAVLTDGPVLSLKISVQLLHSH